MKNSSDNVFKSIPVADGQGMLFATFIENHDLAANSQRAFRQDVRKFASWFTESNREPFNVERVTVRDVTDFRDHLRRGRGQAVATVNRALVTLRRFFKWLVEHDHVSTNPAKLVKELRRQQLAPKGLKRTEVRRLLREVELRDDIRANAVFTMFLYTGGRVSDLINTELEDLIISDRSGSVTFRFGKGSKQRSVPLPLAARRSLTAYLNSRPPVESKALFIGERGPMTDRGIRALCDKYSAICGFRIHPHLLRHTMAHRWLEANGNDLVGLAQILGHENLNTTKRYVQKTEEQLGEASDRLEY